MGRRDDLFLGLDYSRNNHLWVNRKGGEEISV
jgi:hypothetical protein